MKTKLSAFIIAYNEERIIEQCLMKLNWVDEIVVVDSGSTDATVAICEKYGAKVFYKKFEGFGEQKNFALDQTTNDWVINLDSDEVLTDALIEEIKTQIDKNDPEIVGYYIKMRMVFSGTIFNYGNESNRNSLRIFDKTKGKFNQATVHEYVFLNGKTIKLKNHYLHYSYDSINSYINKLNNYTQLYAKNRADSNKRYSVLEIILKSHFEFVKKYFFQFNFLNKKAGFHWALLSSFYMYIKCIKTNEYLKK
jgi:glycosyltransferase involved in cell wall biosynthesis